MSKKELYQVINLIDEDLIAEAEIPQKNWHRLQLKKSLLIAAVAAVLFSVTVWAGNIILVGLSSHSSNIPTYETVPSAEVLQQDIGISLDIKDSYNNGYIFQCGYIIEQKEMYNNNETKTYRGLDCTYVKDQKTLELYVNPASVGTETKDPKNCISYQGCDLVYFSYTMKTLPPDYEMTEQDIKDQKSGKYAFNYGDSEFKITDIQGVAWTHNGIDFELFDFSRVSSKEELIQMAKETIDGQKQ